MKHTLKDLQDETGMKHILPRDLDGQICGLEGHIADLREAILIAQKESLDVNFASEDLKADILFQVSAINRYRLFQ